MVSLTFLGGWQMDVGGRLTGEPDYEKGRALLAYLAIEDRWHSREKLGELFWPGSPACRANLRQVLSNLRAILNDSDAAVPYLLVKRDTLSINPEGLLRLDVAEFTAAAPSCITAPTPAHCAPCIAQMEHMAGLYRGEFMAGFSLPNCPEFEDWLQLQREALHRRALALLERLSNCHEQAGNYGRALPSALRYTELELWDDEGHRRAMRLYALNGQNSAALGQYDFYCRMLEKELGVQPNEETRCLAESIRRGEWRPEHPSAASEPPVTIFPALITERRQVTVLYCELTLAAVDDPDEALALLRTPQARCMEIIRQSSGHIVQAYGGGLLAYFGYPQAREDAARLAVQAALAVSREAAYGIDIRAGVHTGIIITGGEPSMPDTVGRTSGLAIQLRHSVAHDEVAISQQTHCMVAGYFDCISLGVQPLPGFAQPLEIFKVVQESGARTRLEAAAKLTPLVGRKAEITRLMALWKKAAQGSRHVVLVQGEAGIGKSRLLHTLKQRLADQPHAIRELRCFPEFSQSPFHPLIAMLEAVFCFAHGDTPEAKFGKLAKHLETHYPASAQDADPALTQLLSLPPGGHYPAHGLPPQKQKEQIITILLDMLQSLAEKQPMLLIVEDLHWIDQSTLELLTLFVEQTGRGAVLALFTARPEFAPPWKESIGTTLVLAPLVDDDVAKMIASLVEDIPAATMRRIVERADGVPLFAEEMAKIATLDNRAGIPATLHDLLTARMDNMGEAKYTAQLAATLGREFDLNLLRKVFLHDPAVLAQTLSTLQDAGLILKVNETARQFKHALIQEVAYQSQSKADRQAAHRRVAQALQSDFPDVVTTHPELLAQHLSSCGETR